MAEKKVVLEKLAVTKGEIIGKTAGDDGPSLRLRVLHYLNDYLECRLVDSTQSLPEMGQMTLQILFEMDLFTISTSFVSKGGLIDFNVSESMSKIQRRQNFRLRIPIGSPIDFKTEFSPTLYTVVDISAGGVQIHGPKLEQIKINSTFMGVLHVPDKIEMIVLARLAHVRTEDKKDFMGIEFMGLAKKEGDRLAALVMDLYRDLYLKKT